MSKEEVISTNVNEVLDINIICSEIKTTADIDRNIQILAPLVADGAVQVRVKSDLKILVHDNKNFMCIKIEDDLYRNVFLYNYDTNEISSLDGIVGVLFDVNHQIKIKANIEVIQESYPANMVLVYLTSLKELYAKRGV